MLLHPTGQRGRPKSMKSSNQRTQKHESVNPSRYPISGDTTLKSTGSEGDMDNQTHNRRYPISVDESLKYSLRTRDSREQPRRPRTERLNLQKRGGRATRPTSMDRILKKESDTSFYDDRPTSSDGESSESEEFSSESSLPEIEESESSDQESEDFKESSDYESSEEVKELSEGEKKAPLFYQAIHFLRTHCRNDDPADVHTQVWNCLFEPDPWDPDKDTGVVATCGGSSICFIRAEDGDLLLKYDKAPKKQKSSSVDLECELHALAWTTLPLDSDEEQRVNVLAAGGTRSRVLLIRPDEGICYNTFSTSLGKGNVAISALLFHPKRPTWLFCGHEDGNIQIWDIGSLDQDSMSGIRLKKRLIPPDDLSHAYNLTFLPSQDLLVVGYDGGLVSWDAHVSDIAVNETLLQTQLHLPDVDDSGFVVDSICIVRDDLLAVKCALHGYIYVFALSRVMTNRTQIRKSSRYECTVPEAAILKLRWSDTDDYYINMGVDPISFRIVCGDDKGSLWVYDLAQYVNGVVPNPLDGGPQVDALLPTVILPWPDLSDIEVEKAGKVPLTGKGIVMERCTLSKGGKYIVAVTSKNMVCIWKNLMQKKRMNAEEMKSGTSEIIPQTNAENRRRSRRSCV